ncbi:hypothetical protein CapIbe_008723 [Capra ibex]
MSFPYPANYPISLRRSRRLLSRLRRPLHRKRAGKDEKIHEAGLIKSPANIYLKAWPASECLVTDLRAEALSECVEGPEPRHFIPLYLEFVTNKEANETCIAVHQ